MSRLLITILLAVAAIPAIAAPSGLLQIEDIPNTFNTMSWGNYSLKELQSMTASRLQSANIVSAADVCSGLSDDESAFILCTEASKQNSAVTASKMYLQVAANLDDVKFAHFAVGFARKAMTEPLVQKMVAEIQNQVN